MQEPVGNNRGGGARPAMAIAWAFSIQCLCTRKLQLGTGLQCSPFRLIYRAQPETIPAFHRNSSSCGTSDVAPVGRVYSGSREDPCRPLFCSPAELTRVARPLNDTDKVCGTIRERPPLQSSKPILERFWRESSLSVACGADRLLIATNLRRSLFRSARTNPPATRWLSRPRRLRRG